MRFPAVGALVIAIIDKRDNSVRITLDVIPGGDRNFQIGHDEASSKVAVCEEMRWD
jgi:hypothetical protein